MYMIKLLESIPCDEFNVLHDMFESISFPIKEGRQSRRGFPKHRRLIMGITTGRFNNITGLSYETKKYPHIYNELLRIGSLLPFKFTSIHVNKNVVCPRHLDSKNIGDSILISFGDYTGCNIVIEKDGTPYNYDAFCQPILFNGSILPHWNTDDLNGTKYSLVFYTH